MERIKEYLSSPATRVSFCIFLVWIGVTRGSLSSRIDQIEKEMNRIDQMWIETKLTELQIDMQWVKTTLEEIKRAM